MKSQIRLAYADDASAISRVIVQSLRRSNAQDYPADVIARVEKGFSAESILALMSLRQVFVATVDQRVIATASLDHDVVRSVFVDPDHQGLGLGRQLMATLHSVARDANIKTLRVPSSITAEGFYLTLGFVKVRDEFHGAERTIIMEQRI